MSVKTEIAWTGKEWVIRSWQKVPASKWGGLTMKDKSFDSIPYGSRTLAIKAYRQYIGHMNLLVHNMRKKPFNHNEHCRQLREYEEGMARLKAQDPQAYEDYMQAVAKASADLPMGTL